MRDDDNSELNCCGDSMCTIFDDMIVDCCVDEMQRFCWSLLVFKMDGGANQHRASQKVGETSLSAVKGSSSSSLTSNNHDFHHRHFPHDSSARSGSFPQ
jgi:hypothetical protein